MSEAEITALRAALLAPERTAERSRSSMRANRYDTYSRKAQREMRLVTAHLRTLWIRQETNPAVRAMNESCIAVPVPTGDGRALNLAPKFVSLGTDDVLTIHSFVRSLPTGDDGDSEFPQSPWPAWCAAHGFKHVEWTRAALHSGSLELEGLSRLLRHTCNPQRPIDLALRRDVLQALKQETRITFHALACKFPGIDREYVHAAIASLITDRIVFSDIGMRRLSLSTLINAFQPFSASAENEALSAAAAADLEAVNEPEPAIRSAVITTPSTGRNCLLGGTDDRSDFNGDTLPQARQTIYVRKLNAMVAFDRGALVADITAEYHICASEIYRLKDRWNSLDAEGLPLRYRALGHWHHRGSGRKNDITKLDLGIPVAGAFTALLTRYPHVERTMRKFILDGKLPDLKTTVARRSNPTTYSLFVSELGKLNIKSPTYPFNSEDAGRSALRKWSEEIRAERDRRLAKEREAKLRNDQWYCPSEPVTGAYLQAHSDGKNLDVNWTIETPSLTGRGVLRIDVDRLWLIPVQEIDSTAVLGYSIAFGENYDSPDMARAVRSSLVPWTPRRLSSPHLQYEPGECMPTAVIPELAYVCYDELHLDDAQAHRAEITRMVIQRVVGAMLVFGSVGIPDCRPNIEGLFALLDRACFHQIDGTLGSGPDDPNRMRGKKNKRLVLPLELLLDCIDILFCRFNASIRPGTSMTRLEYLRDVAIKQPTLLRRVPQTQREDLLMYDVYDEDAEIGHDQGRTVLRWKDGRYEGLCLKGRSDLIGRKVVICANSLNVTIIKVYLDDGALLGELLIEKRFRHPHSLAMRRQAKRHSSYDGFAERAGDINIAVARAQEEEYHRSGKKGADLARLAAMRAQAESVAVAMAQREAEAAATDMDEQAGEQSSSGTGRDASPSALPAPVLTPLQLRPPPKLSLVQPGAEPAPARDPLDEAIGRLGTTYRRP